MKLLNIKFLNFLGTLESQTSFVTKQTPASQLVIEKKINAFRFLHCFTPSKPLGKH